MDGFLGMTIIGGHMVLMDIDILNGGELYSTIVCVQELPISIVL